MAEKQATNQPFTNDTREYKTAQRNGDYETLYKFDMQREPSQISDARFIANTIQISYGSGSAE